MYNNCQISTIEDLTDKIRLSGQYKKILNYSIEKLKQEIEYKDERIKQLESELIVAYGRNGTY